MRVRDLLASTSIVAVSTSALIYYYFFLQRRKTFIHHIELSSDFCAKVSDSVSDLALEATKTQEAVKEFNSCVAKLSARRLSSVDSEMCDENSIVISHTIPEDLSQKKSQQPKASSCQPEVVKRVESWATIVEQSIPTENQTDILSPSNKSYNTSCYQTNNQQKSKNRNKADKKNRKNKQAQKDSATISPNNKSSSNKSKKASVQKDLLSVLCANDAAALPQMSSTNSPNGGTHVFLNDPSVISVISPSNCS
jgi:hypothetical protein